MRIFRLARKCWGGYLFLLLVYWLFLFAVAFNFPKTFTALMSLGYFCGAYSLGWRAGVSDARPGSVCEPSLIAAFWGGFFGIIISVISLLFIIIGKFTGISGGIFEIFSDIYTFLHFHFLYFITNYGGSLWVYAIPVALVLILYPTGYYFGVRGKSLIEKYFPVIFYKKKDN